MSVRVMSLIFKAKFNDIDLTITKEKEYERLVKASTAKFVCLALADCANDEGESAYPSVDTLARKTDLSTRAIGYTLDALESAGLISKTGISKLSTVNYTLNIEKLGQLVPPIYTGANDTKGGEGMQVIQDTSASDTKNGVSLADKSLFKPSLTHGSLTAESYKERLKDSVGIFEARQAKGGIDWHWLGEGLVHYAEAFTRAAGVEYAPLKDEHTKWRKILQDWQSIGLTDDIIEQTVAKMLRENINMVGPQSVTRMARALKAKSAQGQGNLPPTYHADLGGLSSEEWYKQNVGHK